MSFRLAIKDLNLVRKITFTFIYKTIRKEFRLVYISNVELCIFKEGFEK